MCTYKYTHTHIHTYIRTEDIYPHAHTYIHTYRRNIHHAHTYIHTYRRNTHTRTYIYTYVKDLHLLWPPWRVLATCAHPPYCHAMAFCVHFFTCVTWLIHMCDMTHSNVRHESFTSGTARMCTCGTTQPHVWRDCLPCENGGNRMYLPMGGLRLVGSIKCKVSFRQQPYSCRALLQKRGDIYSILHVVVIWCLF